MIIRQPFKLTQTRDSVVVGEFRTLAVWNRLKRLTSLGLRYERVDGRQSFRRMEWKCGLISIRARDRVD